MALDDAWMTARLRTKKASIITKSEVADAIIKRAKRPILIVGHIAAEIDLDDKKLIDFLIELARKGDIPIVATAHAILSF
jgi:acetyl-CoA decarbonylase/synthase complex subunit epsilon